MILKSFEVKSYRSCRRTSFPLPNNLMGLIGVNGSGKSNTLNSILLLNKLCEEQSWYRFNKDTAESQLNRCSIKVELEHEGKTIKMKAKLKLDVDDHNNDSVSSVSELMWNFSSFRPTEWFNIPMNMISDDLAGKYGYNIRIRSGLFGMDGKINNVIELMENKVFKRDILPLLNNVISFLREINYYSATQFSDPARCPVSIELEDNRLRKRMRFSSRHEQFMFDLYNAYESKSLEYKRYLSTINEEGLGLIDSIKFRTLEMPSNTYRVQSGGRVKEKSEKRSLIVPIFVVKGASLSPNQLSEGTFKTLALLFYILNTQSRLLLIEEPEVCIHHGLLNSLLSIIKSQSKNKQIIISTHSDYVLDSFMPENILLVEYTSKSGTTVKPLRNTMSKNNYDALKDYLQNSGNLGEYWKEGGLL